MLAWSRAWTCYYGLKFDATVKRRINGQSSGFTHWKRMRIRRKTFNFACNISSTKIHFSKGKCTNTHTLPTHKQINKWTKRTSMTISSIVKNQCKHTQLHIKSRLHRQPQPTKKKKYDKICGSIGQAKRKGGGDRDENSQNLYTNLISDYYIHNFIFVPILFFKNNNNKNTFFPIHLGLFK